MTNKLIASAVLLLVSAMIAALMGKNPLKPAIIAFRLMAAVCLSIATTLQAASLFLPEEFAANYRNMGKAIENVTV